MLFRLVLEKNGKPTKTVEIRSASARVGRGKGNEVRIPSDEVSRQHCLLSLRDGLLRVEDLESVNGTYLNGDLLTGEAVARPGDRLEIGPVTFVVEYELTPDALDLLRELDGEVVAADDIIVEEEDAGEILLEGDDFEAADEETDERRKEKTKPPQKKKSPPTEEIEEDEVLDAEAAVEAEDEAPRAELDLATWNRPDEGDLHDLLSHLDEGQESLLPRKRPSPRKPIDKGGKNRPESEE